MTESLPVGWIQTTLGEVAEVQLGKMLSAKSRSGVGSTPYLRNENVRWGTIETHDLNAMDFSEPEREKFRLVRGDALVCEGGEPGRAAVWRDQVPGTLFQKALHRVRFRARALEPALFVYYLEWYAGTGRLKTHFSGSTIKHLPRERFLQMPVRIPPVREQIRIVAALEEHLSRLDAANEVLALARRRYSQFRLSVLHAECTPHELTAESSYWTRSTLGELAVSVRNGISAKPTEASGDPILRIGAVRPLSLDTADVRFLPSASSWDSYQLEVDDLLFTRYNGNPELTGSCARVRDVSGRLLYPDKLIRVRVDTSRVLPSFVECAVAVGQSRAFLRSRSRTSAGQTGISGRDLQQMPIAFPPLPQQAKIVARIDAALEAGRQLLTGLERADFKAKRLRSTILSLALSGKLVTQDPLDEPASALLDRIRAEPASAPSPRRRSRTTTAP